MLRLCLYHVSYFFLMLSPHCLLCFLLCCLLECVCICLSQRAFNKFLSCLWSNRGPQRGTAISPEQKESMSRESRGHYSVLKNNHHRFSFLPSFPFFHHPQMLFVWTMSLLCLYQFLSENVPIVMKADPKDALLVNAADISLKCWQL